MKAVILTYAPVSDFEKNILKNTNIFKIALNQHAEELNPHVRIITDYFLENIHNRFSQKIISLRDRLKYPSKRVEYPELEFKGSTIIAAAKYLILKNYKEILIVGDNKVNSEEFRNMVNQDMEKLLVGAKFYQYANGNFNLPIMSIYNFCR